MEREYRWDDRLMIVIDYEQFIYFYGNPPTRKWEDLPFIGNTEEEKKEMQRNFDFIYDTKYNYMYDRSAADYYNYDHMGRHHFSTEKEPPLFLVDIFKSRKDV